MAPGSLPPEGPSPAAGGALARAGRALIALQTKRPLLLLLVAALTVALAAAGAAQLKLKTSFGELLPQNKESVIVADEVSKRLASASTLTIVAEGQNTEALKRFVDAVAPKIRALGPTMVGAVDDGVKASQDFFEKNRFLYAPLEDVQKVHDEIVSRYDYEVQKRAGFDLGLDDEDEKPPPPITKASIEQRIDEKKADAEAKYPGGYYLDAKEGRIVILVRTPVSVGDEGPYRTLLAAVNKVIGEVHPEQIDPAMKVTLAGDFITGAEEYDQIKNDLSHVGATGVLMILGVVFLFYLRPRTIAAMMLTVTIGVTWTFGMAYLLIGHLNSSTGFLVSIVVGNGINFGIIYMSRYLEARRTASAEESIRTAHADTWLSTLAAAGAAMVAYGSLIITDFRGFKHFGIIGGSGMALCWLATYLFMPAILSAFERILPVKEGSGFASRVRGAYGRPFAWLIDTFPRALGVFGVVTGLLSMALTVHYFISDPMEYDMANTRNAPKTTETTARQLGHKVEKIVGRQGQDGLAIMVDRLEQVLPLKEALDARRAAAAPELKPFDKVVTIYDLLPTDQDRKIPLVIEARDRVERAHRRGFVSEADWADIQKDLPSKDLKPLAVEDLPEQVARSFVEKDGTRGRLVYIVPKAGRSVWDAHYLILWADSFRRTALPDGSVVRGSGRSVIFADLILTVVEDAPKAIIASLGGTLLIILFAFRGKRAALAVMGTLLLGIAWMMAVIALYDSKVTFAGGVPHIDVEGMKLNFLNFVSLPISIGVGADYALNVMQRYRIAGRGQIHRVILETGGAVILCSLTTVLGYFALTFSVNRAIVSFGVAAAAGEVSCLMAAVLILPAILSWRERGSRPTAASQGDNDVKARAA